MSHDPTLGIKTEAAVHDWISGLGDGKGMVTSFYLLVEFIDDDGDEAWVYATSTGQKTSTTMGLLQWGMGVAEYEQKRYLREIYGDHDS